MNLKVSVIIPCYNQGHFLTDAIQSVLSQTYTDWECIIVNDGSTDDTEKVALRFSRMDPRIKYFKKANGGLSSARNKGLDEATGAFIQFLDSDDMLAAEKFSRSMNASGTADIIMSDFVLFTLNDDDCIKPGFKLSKDHFNFESILSGWDNKFVFPPHCGLFKSELFNQLRFDEMLTAREDWLMWLQIYLLKTETIFIEEPLALYRLSANSMSKNKRLMDENQVLVFRILYKLLPEKYHEIYFEKVINTLGGLLSDCQNILSKTRESNSYRIGNYLIRNINKFTGRKNSNRV